MTEPSKEDLRRARIIRKNFSGTTMDGYAMALLEDQVLKALAEVRAEGERERKKIEDRMVKNLTDLLSANQCPKHQEQTKQERFHVFSERQIKIGCVDCLQAENERLRDFSKSYDVTENSVYQEAKKEIDRLTSALATAHEALKPFILPEGNYFTDSVGRITIMVRLNDVRNVGHVLADKDGTLAFEKWKKIVEAVEQFVQCGECSTCSCCLDIGKEALESLDAKGASDV